MGTPSYGTIAKSRQYIYCGLRIPSQMDTGVTRSPNTFRLHALPAL
jgi:hypothetical protein